jgi:DNA-binding MarR family transcriptional regulator
MDGCRIKPGVTAVALNPKAYEGLAAFRHALRQFLAYSEAVTQDVGVTPQQYQALLIIKTHPRDGMMVKELADEMLLLHNGAVQLVDRLAHAGLIERKPSPIDGRSVLVSITDQGAALLEDLASSHINELLRHEPLLAESLRRLRQIESPRKVRLG